MDIERVSPADVTELLCDVSGTSMQVAAVLVLDAPVDLEAARHAFADRIPAVPRMRQRLVHTPLGCGRPAWLDDPDFDIARHLTSVQCPAPGDEQAMLAVVAATVTRRLPPDQPLWAATLIIGLAGARAALVLVTHHVLTDGIGGLAILGQLADGTSGSDIQGGDIQGGDIQGGDIQGGDVPVGDDPGGGATVFPRHWPTRRDLLVDAFGSRGRAVRRLPAGLGRVRAAAAELGTRHVAAGAPQCSLNRPVGPRRALAVVRSDLAAIRQVAHSRGGTVNDVIVTAVTGALRAVLADRGETVDRLVVSMPVSARRQAGASELGNQVGVIPVSIPATGDPLRRLAAVAAITSRAKTATPGASAALIGPVFRGLARVGVFGWFIARQRLINTFVSNLRGPERRMSFLGARVVDIIAMSMLTGNVTVAFTALSYAGTLLVTVVADPERCPDLPDLQRAVGREFEELTSRSAPAPAPTQARHVAPS